MSINEPNTEKLLNKEQNSDIMTQESNIHNKDESLDEHEIVNNLDIEEDNDLDSSGLSDSEEVIKVNRDLIQVNEVKPHLVKPSKEKLERLLKIRKYNRFKKMFHSVHEGSLRKIVLLMVRMTVGVGILTLPYYVKEFGGLIGVLFLLLAAAISYMVYAFLIDVSNETGIYDYVLLSKRYCNDNIRKLFRFTYLIDLISMPILITILSWNILEYLMAMTGLAKDEWIIDHDNMTFNEYNKELLLIRLAYCVVIFFIILPLLFKKDLATLQSISNVFLFFLLFLLFIILIEMPFFRKNLKDTSNFKVNYISAKPKIQWIECFFSVLLSFYCQPYYFAIRNELMHPTKKRLKKLVGTSMVTIVTFFILIGFVCYLCLGDNYTPDIVILRKAYAGKSKWSEVLFQIAIGCFFLISVVSMPIFNPPIRDYILVEFKFAKTRRNFVIWSILPFLLACVICFVYPTIIGVFNFFSTTVFNFNG